MNDKIWLLKPPFFTPWTPPLGISILKSFLEQHNYSARCFDFNTDSKLWGTHHKYFAALQALECVSINDGYSKLWNILNAHMLTYLNSGNPAACSRVLETVIPLYGLRYDDTVIGTLLPIVESYFRRLEDLTDRFDLSDVSVIGTSTYTTSLASSLFILGRVKRKYPHIRTVMGGGVFADDLALGSDNLNTLLEEYPYVDHAVLGEGELLFLKLLRGEFANARVISIADAQGVTLPMKEVPVPDFSDLNSEHYYHLTIEGARSCPFQCQFCSETIQWGDYRKKPMDLFADQVMALAQKYKNNSYFMGDSLMNPYIPQFADELLKRGASILYDGYLRADKPVTDRNRVRLWARSGLYRVRLGIESAAARVLNAMDKMTTPEVIANVLKSLASAGIRTTTYWIVGFPGETEEDFQQTLDFIREYHPFIYELEAHPYYYYPYGQIGSRQHQSYSVYPDEVTKLIKFKVWEVLGCQPTREERYERLHRISQLAADMGLINIYTMEERFKAEDRWHRLFPLVTEVYKGTRLQRGEAHPPESPVEAFFKEEGRPLPENLFDARSVLCYRALVHKRLDEATLSASIDQLIRYNEMLQVRLRDGKYMAVSEEAPYDCKVLALYSWEGEDKDKFDVTREGIIAELSAVMWPERHASLRIALIQREPSACEILLLVHRAVADSRSVAFLFEDLFRIYEQVWNGREISLRPVQKTYTDFIRERSMANNPTGPSPSFSGSTPRETPDLNRATPSVPVRVKASNGQAVVIPFGQSLTKKIFSKTLREYDLKPAELLVAALLKSRAPVNASESMGVHIIWDYRTADRSLEHTLGPLMGRFSLPLEVIKADDLVSDLKQIRQALREMPLNFPAYQWNGTDGAGTLLNFEYFVEEPWLGGDDWIPQGFVIHGGEPAGNYEIEIVPVLRGGSIEVHFKPQDTAGLKDFVTGIGNHMIEQVERILDHCERYVAAKRFWSEDLSHGVHGLNMDISITDPAALDGAPASIRGVIEKTIFDKVQSAYKADPSVLMLVAYSVLLARVNEREDLLVLSSIMAQDGAVDLVPVRLSLPWKLSFLDLVRQTEQKLRLARGHAAYALDILASGLRTSKDNHVHPTLDVGFVFKESHGQAEVMGGMKSVQECYPALARRLSLILEVVRASGDLNIQFIYEKSRFEHNVIRKLSGYLASLVEEVARNTQIPVGDIILDKDQRKVVESDILARDNFNF